MREGLRSGRVESNREKMRQKLREKCEKIAVPQPNLPKPQGVTLLHRRPRMLLCLFKQKNCEKMRTYADNCEKSRKFAKNCEP